MKPHDDSHGAAVSTRYDPLALSSGSTAPGRSQVQALRGRRGAVFSVRVTDEERAAMVELQRETGGPVPLGSWMRWRALTAPHVAVTRRRGTTAPRQGSTASSADLPPVSERVILDLCGGSGAWSKPYADAGYPVVVVTLPEHDVRTFVPPPRVHGVLAAPPCPEFSTARRDDLRSSPRDFIRGMEVVNACMRVVLQCAPRWWAIENPTGHLSKFLGTPRDVWQPADFGDPWTKQTALWGSFALPKRGPFVKPLGNGPFCRVCDPAGARRSWCANAAHRAVTPSGFARAFMEANP